MAKKTAPLTFTQIEKAKGKEKPYHLADGQGLLLLIKPTGVKVWQFNYCKPITNKRTYLSLGHYPSLSLAQARELREQYRTLLAQGVDPLDHKKQQEAKEKMIAETTFLSVAESWKEKKQKEVTEKTINKEYGRLQLYVLPYLGYYPLKEITAPLAIEILKPVYNKGLNDTLHRLIRMIKEILNYAVNCGLVEYNTCINLNKVFHKEPQTKNPTIKPDELPQFMQTLLTARIEHQTRYLIQWQLLTMVRPAEAVSAEWADIDFTNNLWHIPAEKMKGTRNGRLAHTVPLSSQAIALLYTMQKISGGKQYIFPHYADPKRHMSKETANTAIKRMGYKDRLTAHGMRALASTYLNELELNPDVIEACLAHTVRGEIRRVYNRSQYLEHRKEVMQIWADYVEQCSNVNLLAN